MRLLVIIPSTKPGYEIGFSAPLAWLFSGQAVSVYGIYSYELNEEHLKSYDTFLIELNWFTELYEFTLLVAYIKKHNRNSKIMFGGLFSSLMYKTIFDRYEVDYYIKGDNEKPMQMFLEGIAPENIPNFVGRDFENETTYIFNQEDFKNLDFNLDWFPSYFDKLKSAVDHDAFCYKLPMIITTKSGCTTIHKGCDYCMGSHTNEMEAIYCRKPLAMKNDILLALIKKVVKKYKEFTVYINSKYEYDFSGEYFDAFAYFEIDSVINKEQLQNIFKAFRKCGVLIPIYEEGIMGSSLIDYKEFLELEDENHYVRFPAYTYDEERLSGIPRKNIIYNLDTAFAPGWARWEAYSNFDVALFNSNEIYDYFNKKSIPVFGNEIQVIAKL